MLGHPCEGTVHAGTQMPTYISCWESAVQLKYRLETSCEEEMHAGN